LTTADLGLYESIPVTPLPKPTSSRRPSRHYVPALALAASLLLTVSVLIKPLGYYFADYSTSPGQQRQITLADGSQITLNTDSAISVDFDPQQRRIRLIAGEAYFTIAPDNGRPFVVTTDEGEVQALGTAFDITCKRTRPL
jgi:transmembrane sensor